MRDRFETQRTKGDRIVSHQKSPNMSASHHQMAAKVRFCVGKPAVVHVSSYPSMMAGETMNSHQESQGRTGYDGMCFSNPSFNVKLCLSVVSERVYCTEWKIKKQRWSHALNTKKATHSGHTFVVLLTYFCSVIAISL